MKHYTFIFLILLNFPVYAQFGSLDPSFGTGGKVVTDIGGFDDAGWSVAIQNDAKIIVGGYGKVAIDSSRFALVRYNNDGSLDPSFGIGGKTMTTFGVNTSSGYSVAIENDGKILIAGSVEAYGNRDFALSRYNSDGSLDSTFDSDGKVITDFGRPYDAAHTVAIQTDGKIIVAGGTGFWYDYDFALARYESNGSLDNTFGVGGKVITPIGTYIDYAYSLAIQGDGKILVAGQSFNDADTTNSFAVLRYNADGSLDNSFGTDGKVSTDFISSDDLGNSIILQNNGKILVSGWCGQYENWDFAIMRYNFDGTLDSTFGIGGKAKTVMGANSYWKNSVALQNDGKIIVAGFKTNTPDNDFSLALYNSDGSLDNSFGSNGIVVTDFGGYDDKALSVTVQGDGKIVASGMSYNGNNFDFALTRYNGSKVGIEEKKEISNVNIYPNPNSGSFTVDLKSKAVGANILVYDLLGNCLLNKSCRHESSSEIDLSSQPKGIYFMEVVSEGNKSINKIVLQ